MGFESLKPLLRIWKAQFKVRTENCGTPASRLEALKKIETDVQAGDRDIVHMTLEVEGKPIQLLAAVPLGFAAKLPLT